MQIINFLCCFRHSAAVINSMLQAEATTFDDDSAKRYTKLDILAPLPLELYAIRVSRRRRYWCLFLFLCYYMLIILFVWPQWCGVLMLGNKLKTSHLKTAWGKIRFLRNEKNVLRSEVCDVALSRGSEKSFLTFTAAPVWHAVLVRASSKT